MQDMNVSISFTVLGLPSQPEGPPIGSPEKRTLCGGRRPNLKTNSPCIKNDASALLADSSFPVAKKPYCVSTLTVHVQQQGHTKTSSGSTEDPSSITPNAGGMSLMASFMMTPSGVSVLGS